MTDVRLRERDFGTWDGTADANYHRVWRDDAASASHTVQNVESVDAVTQRVTECVAEWDAVLESSQRHMVVLIAHPGTSCIFFANGLDEMARHATSQHRALGNLETATVRAFELKKIC